jgi:hypothetical protein
MKIFAHALAATLIIGTVGLAPAAAIAPASGHPDSSNWQPLFDEDLSNAEYPAGVWSVRDGVLTATKDQAIWTKKPFDNFVLDLEFKTTPGANSGIIIYCSKMEDWIPNSIEIQICDDYAEKWAKMPSTWHCGAVFGHLGPSKTAVKKPGEWNRCTISCKDKTVCVVINGDLVTELDMSKWTSAKRNPDGSEIPPWLSKPLATLPTHGHIGLQGKHAGALVYYRNVKIKVLE